MVLWVVDGHTQDQVESQLNECIDILLGVPDSQRSRRNSMATSVVRFRLVDRTVKTVLIAYV
jgi:hypothetical protein